MVTGINNKCQCQDYTILGYTESMLHHGELTYHSEGENVLKYSNCRIRQQRPRPVSSVWGQGFRISLRSPLLRGLQGKSCLINLEDNHHYHISALEIQT